MALTISPIGHIETDFTEKFGIPRQAGIVESLTARVVFREEYRNPDALRGLEDFSHIWLIWEFTESPRGAWQPTVRPPRLGGNERRGVFATRSPNRPNPLGLSCVRLLGIEMDEKLGPVLLVGGADMLSGTPIYDIKPYIPYADCIPGAESGFAPDAGENLEIEIPEGLLARIPAEKRDALIGVLELDPRPAYHNDPQRIYGMSFAGAEIKFSVDGIRLRVLDIII